MYELFEKNPRYQTFCVGFVGYPIICTDSDDCLPKESLV